MASKTNKLNLPSCRLHSLSAEAKEIAFKPSADTYVFMPVSKAMKMARCPGLRKKPMPLFLNLKEPVYRNTVRGTPNLYDLCTKLCSCNVGCVRACMKAMGRAENVEVIIQYWSLL
jgi:hypothetical protein